jgi:DNA-methyltransferase (dcm)
MKFIDLFCGAGGLSCGLEQAGFVPVLASEIEPVFASTYRTNHPHVPVIEGDIRNIGIGEIDRIGGETGCIDLVAGGPPCQGYSIIAPERTVNDPRNHLFREFLRIVEHVRPKAVLIENVPGIVSFEKGLIVRQLYERLSEMGYKTGHMILCAAHYGVPQMRFRTFFVSIHGREKRIRFPYPTHKADVHQNFTNAKELCFRLGPLQEIGMLPQVGVMDAIGDLPAIRDGERQGEFGYETDPKTGFQKYAREGNDRITSHYCARLSNINRERLKHIPQGGSWRDIPFELLPNGLRRARRSDHTKRYGRLSPDGLCSTIQTKCDPHWGCFFHPTQERVISVREAARLQSFPDRERFMGSMTEQYRQVGNAVPPLLGHVIGNCVKEMLEGD